MNSWKCMKFAAVTVAVGMFVFGASLAGAAPVSLIKAADELSYAPGDGKAGPPHLGVQPPEKSVAKYPPPAPSPFAAPGGSAATVGGDTCASAGVIGSLPFSDSGNTCSYVDDYDEVCPYTGSLSPDVVYSYTPGASGTIDITLCNGSGYDTKLYLYTGSCPGTLVACNDDTCPGYVSELLGVPVTAGTTYYIVVDGYGGDCGDYIIDITGAAGPCTVDCPPGGVPEAEACGDDTNGGCNSAPAVFEPIACGETKCGTVWADAGRDTDWYTIVLAQASTVTVDIAAEAPTVVFFLDTGGTSCSGISFVDDGNGFPWSEDCIVGTGSSVCLDAGTYTIWVGTSPPDGSGIFDGYPCTFDYTVTVDCVDCGAPGCPKDVVVTAPGSWTGNTCGMVDDCDVTGSDNEDVIYSVTLPNAGDWTFTLCGSGYDTKLGVGTSCCSEDIGYNDDSDCGAGFTLQSTVTATLPAGEVWVTVDGFGSSCGDYILDISKAGGGCVKDKTIDIPTCDTPEFKWLGNTMGAGDDSSCRGSEDLIIGFNIGQAGTYSFDLTTNVDPCAWDGYMFLTAGDPCACDGVVALNDDCPGIGCFGLSCIVDVDLAPGQYWIVVEGYGSGDAGPVDLHVTSVCAPSSCDKGNDTCATAVEITALPYKNIGTTVGCLNDYDEVCPYTGSTSPDVAYSYTPTDDVEVNIRLCKDGGATDYDTKLYVYAGGCPGTLIACNDDACPNYSIPYVSELEGVPMTAGTTYYIIVDGYGGDLGTYEINMEESVPCVVDCDPNKIPENEPTCMDEYVDNTNGGCNSVGEPFSPIGCGDRICGESGGFLVAGGDNRDTDWYEVVLGINEPVMWTVEAEFDVLIFLIDGNAGCGGLVIIDSATAGACEPVSLSANLGPGTFWLWVGPSGFGPGAATCGDRYNAELSLCTGTIPTGACCDGTGCQVITESECDALGGSYLGDDASCTARADCNGNGVVDTCDIFNGAADCQPDGVPDECQLTDNDCNGNGVPDECDLWNGRSARGSTAFYADQASFEAAANAAQKTVKEGETFEEAEADVGGGMISALDDPLDSSSYPAGNPGNAWFQPGDIPDNVAFQSNLDAPGVNGVNPRGPSGLAGATTGFFGVPNTVMVANTFVDSFDVYTPGADNHTAMGLNLITLLGGASVEVRVFDKAENEIGMTTVNLTSDPNGFAFGFVGFVSPMTIGRVNIWDSAGGAEGLFDVTLWLGYSGPPPNDCNENGIPDECDCGNGAIDFCSDGTQMEECDDGNNADGDCCSATCTLDAMGTACGDVDPLGECDGGDTCDAAGTCLENNIADGTACTDDGNDCTDDVCDAKQCTHPNWPSGTACGDVDPLGDCDDGDTCDGAGTCDENNILNGTPCSDDGNDCTNDVCSDKQCTHPNWPAGTSCGNTVVTDCDDADTCDGAGTCDENNRPVGEACDDDGDRCTDDVCGTEKDCTHPRKANDDPDACGACCYEVAGKCYSDKLRDECLGDTWDANEFCADDGGTIACEKVIIPTISEWGLLVISLLLLVGIVAKFGRRAVVKS